MPSGSACRFLPARYRCSTDRPTGVRMYYIAHCEHTPEDSRVLEREVAHLTNDVWQFLGAFSSFPPAIEALSRVPEARREARFLIADLCWPVPGDEPDIHTPNIDGIAEGVRNLLAVKATLPTVEIVVLTRADYSDSLLALAQSAPKLCLRALWSKAQLSRDPEAFRQLAGHLANGSGMWVSPDLTQAWRSALYYAMTTAGGPLSRTEWDVLCRDLETCFSPPSGGKRLERWDVFSTMEKGAYRNHASDYRKKLGIAAGGNNLASWGRAMGLAPFQS